MVRIIFAALAAFIWMIPSQAAGPGPAPPPPQIVQGSPTSGQKGDLIFGAVSTIAPSYTNGQSSPLSLDTSGNLRVNVVAGGAGGGAVTVADGADVTLGAKADAACGTDNGTCTLEALLKRNNQNLTTLNTTAGGSVPAGTNVIGTVGLTSQYPVGATAITASSTGTTGATTATLAGTSGKTTYICGFSIRANATAAATADSTVTGTITGTLHFTQWTAPLASGIGLTEQIFNPCIPASATNTGIAIISAAPGSGGVVSSTGWGFQL